MIAIFDILRRAIAATIIIDAAPMIYFSADACRFFIARRFRRLRKERLRRR